MEQYDIYKSEGGYRVAVLVHLGWPDTQSSPWFCNRGLAAAWRTRVIARKIKKWEEDTVYPVSIVVKSIAELKSILAAAQKREKRGAK